MINYVQCCDFNSLLVSGETIIKRSLQPSFPLQIYLCGRWTVCNSGWNFNTILELYDAFDSMKPDISNLFDQTMYNMCALILCVVLSCLNLYPCWFVIFTFWNGLIPIMVIILIDHSVLYIVHWFWIRFRECTFLLVL